MDNTERSWRQEDGGEISPSKWKKTGFHVKHEMLNLYSKRTRKGYSEIGMTHSPETEPPSKKKKKKRHAEHRLPWTYVMDMWFGIM
jgi:hypothetical protein